MSYRWLPLLLWGCGRVAFNPEPIAVDAIDAIDVSDACAVERVDLGPFGRPQLIAATSTPNLEDDPILSPDGLALYFASNRIGGLGAEDIYVTRRQTPTDAWGAVDHVPTLSSPMNDNTPAISSDGLEMWVVSNRDGGLGSEDLWVSVRGAPNAPWPVPALVPELSSPQLDRGPAPFAADLRIMLHTNRPGGRGDTDFWESSRASRAAAWDAPTLLPSLNTAGAEIHAWVSPCGLRVFFQADRGAQSGMDFYTASRASLDDDFGPEQRIDELSTSSYDQDIHLSRDLRYVVFSSDISGNGELYEASR